MIIFGLYRGESAMELNTSHAKDTGRPGKNEPHAQQHPFSDILRTLSPTDHLDSLFNDNTIQWAERFSPHQFLALEKLYSYLERSYNNSGFIGRGYHCLEHSLEVAVLLYEMAKCAKVKSLNRFGNNAYMFEQHPIPLLKKGTEYLLELAVAAMLHDWDPARTYNEIPKVDRTLCAVTIDNTVLSLIREMNMSVNRILLLIERTEYPYTSEKNSRWLSKVCVHIPADESASFVRGAESLALADKASTYLVLPLEMAIARIRGLADEMCVPESDLVAGTYQFLYEENIFEVLNYLPEEYWTSSKEMSEYFKAHDRSTI